MVGGVLAVVLPLYSGRSGCREIRKLDAATTFARGFGISGVPAQYRIQIDDTRIMTSPRALQQGDPAFAPLYDDAYGGAVLCVHRGLAGFAALKESWLRLTAHDERYWMQYAFYEEMIRRLPFGSDGVTTYSVADETGTTVAIVPLRTVTVRIRRFPFRCAELLGSTFDEVTCQASSVDFPAASTSTAAMALRMVLHALRTAKPTPSLLLIGRVAAASRALAAALTVDGKSTAHAVVGGSKWLSVERPFADIQRGLGKRFRAGLRKSRKDLSMLGTLEFGLTSRFDGAFEAAFEEFLEIEASGWKGRAGTATGLLVNPSPWQREFLEAIARRTDAAPCELHWLKLNGETIASQLWMRTDSCRVGFKAGYREAFARFQPGHLLLEHILRDSCDDAFLRTVDFVSDGSWLDKWRAGFSSWNYHYLPVARLRGAIAAGLLSIPSLSALPESVASRLSRLFKAMAPRT
jgi:CelD/BcsL family acetyltransferase involved in cellulose biosynthesis